MILWVLKFAIEKNLLEQVKHAWSFVRLACVSEWIFRIRFIENTLLHWEHANGLSAVWEIWCVLRLTSWEKYLSHFSHWYGLIPVCIFWWFSKALFVLNNFPERATRNPVIHCPCFCTARWCRMGCCSVARSSLYRFVCYCIDLDSLRCIWYSSASQCILCMDGWWSTKLSNRPENVGHWSHWRHHHCHGNIFLA